MRALKIDMDGNISEVEWDPKEKPTLRVLQEAVEGLVDVVCLGPDECGVDMWINDEGLYTHEKNLLATYVADVLRGAHYQDYHGPALFTGGVDDEGETLPLSPEQEKKIRRLASEVMV